MDDADIARIQIEAEVLRIPNSPSRNEPVADLLDAAAAEIVRLREQLENIKTLTRLAQVGPSFADMKRDAKCAPTNGDASNADAAS